MIEGYRSEDLIESGDLEGSLLAMKRILEQGQIARVTMIGVVDELCGNKAILDPQIWADVRRIWQDQEELNESIKRWLKRFSGGT